MKRLLASVCISITLVTTPVVFTGCVSKGTIAISSQSTDQIILRAEQAAEAADLTFHTFVHLERDNEGLLKRVNPAIHTWANTVRANGQNWLRASISAIKTFKDSRTAENRATLNTALATLNDMASKTNTYLIQAKKVSQP